MVQGFFYNSVDGDRKYNGSSVNESKRPFYKDGVFAGHLEVTADGEEMAVTVEGGEKTGYAWINSHTIHNTTPLKLDISQASGTLDRIDRVVIRNDETERKPSIYILEGNFASVPIAQELTNTDVIQEKCLAEIYVRAGAVAVSQAEIRDTRADETLCGFVACQFEEFDFAQWQKQFDAYMNIQRQEWEEWIQDKKNMLSGDVAGKLLVQIDNLKTYIENLQTEIRNMKICKSGSQELKLESDFGQSMVHMTVKSMGGKTKLTLSVDDWKTSGKLPNLFPYGFEIPKAYLPFEMEVNEEGISEILNYEVPFEYFVVAESGNGTGGKVGFMTFRFFIRSYVKEGYVRVNCSPDRTVTRAISQAAEGTTAVIIESVSLTL